MFSYLALRSWSLRGQVPLDGTCGCAFLLPINLKPVLSQTGKVGSNYSQALHMWHLLSIAPPSSLDESSFLHPRKLEPTSEHFSWAYCWFVSLCFANPSSISEYVTVPTLCELGTYERQQNNFSAEFHILWSVHPPKHQMSISKNWKSWISYDFACAFL